MYLEIVAGLLSILLWSVYRKLTLWSRYGVPYDHMHFIKSFQGIPAFIDKSTLEKSGKVIGVYAFLEPMLLIGDLNIARKVLSTQFEDFVNHSRFQQVDAPMGDSLFTTNDDRWREMKRIISPSFTPAKVRSMQSLIDDSCSDLIKQFELNENMSMDIKNSICGFALDVIASTAFGTKVNTAKNPENEIAVSARRCISPEVYLKALSMVLFPWLSLDVFKMSIFTDTAQFFADFTMNIIHQRRKDISLQRNDLIKFMMEAEHDGKRLTDKQMADNGVLFLIAAHDTTAIGLIHCFHFLALHPEIQGKLHHEIDDFHSSGEELDYDRIKKLEYLDCVIKETLRLRSPISRTSRVTSRDTVLGTYRIPKGATMWIANHFIQTDAANFECPEQFIPERFLRGSNLFHNPQAFVAFAPGPRNCVGEQLALFEMKICLLRVLRWFRFETCSSTERELDYTAFMFFMFQPKAAFLRPVRREVSSGRKSNLASGDD